MSGELNLSLSTNWCNRRIESGEEIVDKALALGFDSLELGYSTTRHQVEGFRRRLNEMPVGSVHAFCPIPVSAPGGHPELYMLAAYDKEERALARVNVIRNIEFASSVGATALVLHAGRVMFSGLFEVSDSITLRSVFEKAGGKLDAKAYAKKLARAKKRRISRGKARLEAFRAELDAIIPTLQAKGVTLALENLPYLEGFPNEDEMTILSRDYAGAPIAGWFDTGHDRVRRFYGWESSGAPAIPTFTVAGMHLNDVVDRSDDHFQPGGGKVDFASLADFARSLPHLVFEPNSGVSEDDLKKSLELIRGLWKK